VCVFNHVSAAVYTETWIVPFQASPIEINGRQIYVEERKPNSGIRGGRRGGRGRFGGGGRGYARGGGDEYNGGNRGRSNGYGRVPHQERGILGSHAQRN